MDTWRRFFFGIFSAQMTLWGSSKIEISSAKLTAADAMLMMVASMQCPGTVLSHVRLSGWQERTDSMMVVV